MFTSDSGELSERQGFGVCRYLDVPIVSGCKSHLMGSLKLLEFGDRLTELEIQLGFRHGLFVNPLSIAHPGRFGRAVSRPLGSVSRHLDKWISPATLIVSPTKPRATMSQ